MFFPSQRHRQGQIRRRPPRHAAQCVALRGHVAGAAPDAMVVSEHVFFLVESLLISLNHVMICHDKKSQAIKVT